MLCQTSLSRVSLLNSAPVLGVRFADPRRTTGWNLNERIGGRSSIAEAEFPE